MENNSQTKKCNRCKKLLSNINYNKRKIKKKDGSILETLAPRCKKCLYDMQIEYREKNKEKIKIRDAKYYLTVKNKRRQQEINRLAIPENRKKRCEYIKRYKAEKRNKDPSFKLYESLRKKIWKSLNNKSNSSIEYLGCDIHFYEKWIEYTMETDMNWKNYGTIWNIDHVIPVNLFKLSDNEQAKKAFNWKNTCARYASENFSKKNSIIEDHNIKQKILLQEFENNVN